MVGAYDPTEDSDKCVKDDFYDRLQQSPINENGLRLLNLCGHFGLVLTNTLNNIKTKDIFTYKDKGPHGVWRLIDYVAIWRRHLYTLSQISVLRGVQKFFPSADHHLVRSILALGRSTSEEGTKKFQKC